MARIKDKLVEPADLPSAESDAIESFLRRGWAPEDARWLGPLAYSVLREPRDDDETGLGHATEHNLQMVADAAKVADPRNCRDRALLIAYARLCGVGGKGCEHWRTQPPVDQPANEPPRAPMGLEDWKRIAGVFRSPGKDLPGANFEAALITGGWPGTYASDNEIGGVLSEFVRDGAHPVYGAPEVLRLMHVLVDAAGLNLAAVIDEGALVAMGCRRGGPDPHMPLRVPAEVDRKRPPIANARSLTNWMIGLGPRALTSFFPVFERCPNDGYLAAMAVGIQDAIEHWLMCGTHHWTYYREGGPRLAAACRPYLNHLQSRCAAAQPPSEPQLRRAWLWFAWCVYEADPNLWQSLHQDEQERILRAANEDLSHLRPLFARARLKPETPALTGEGFGHLLPGETRAPWEEFKWEEGHFTTCVMLLYQFGGVWRGMKPLLLAIRAFACPCVARDLRHWNEQLDHPGPPHPLDQPPDPWSIVPGSMINLFHHYVNREQALDSELTQLRGTLAEFCLERLGDRWSKGERAEAERTGRQRTNADMIERSPEWRLCLVRAVASLYINPAARGHKVLLHASNTDPDNDVKEAAHAAYEQTRRFKELPENVSPRRTVMSALWWIRQAHLLGLEIEPDKDGAQRTRIKELNRTKEMERAHALAMRQAKH